MSKPKKRVSVSAISTFTTSAKKKDAIFLERVPCIHYLVQFQKRDKKVTRALINPGRKVNVMTPAYAKKLGLQIHQTNVGNQKIDGFSLEMFEIVITGFQVVDKLSRVRFFQETFILAETSMEVVLGISFLTFSNMDI